MSTREIALKELVRSIPVEFWSQCINVQVDHRLGFKGQRQFKNLYETAKWLGFFASVRQNPKMPYRAWVIPNFTKNLTIENLMKNCQKYPESLLTQA